MLARAPLINMTDKEEQKPQQDPPKKPEDEKPSLAWQSFEAEAIKLLPDKDFKLLQHIAVSIGQDGMTVREACQLVNVEYEHFKELAVKHTVVGKIISLKELEYKRSLMRSMSKKARGGDDKLAAYLLENRYPDEFGKKRGGDATPGADLLAEAVHFIQEHGDTDELIKRQRSTVIGSPRMRPVAPSTPEQKLANFLV